MRLLAVASVFVAPLPAAAQGVAAWQPYVIEASARYGVPIAWIERVMRIESNGQAHNGGRPIVSSAGAMGLMQLMPATWTAMREIARLGADPFDPHDNILAGTLYLRLLYDRFGYPGMFAAYNVGPGRYGDYLAGRRQLPGETVRYLAVLLRAEKSRSATPVMPVPSRALDWLFVRATVGEDEVRTAPSASLFAIRKGD